MLSSFYNQFKLVHKMLLPHYYYRIKGVAAAFVSRQQQIICQQSTSSSDDDRVGEHQHYIIDELERPQSPPINLRP
jgi:hypothetical protein